MQALSQDDWRRKSKFFCRKVCEKFGVPPPSQNVVVMDPSGPPSGVGMPKAKRYEVLAGDVAKWNV